MGLRMTRRKLAGAIVVLALVGCRRPPAPRAAEATPLPRLDIDAKRTDLVFSYFDGDGHYHDVTQIEEVPKERRKQVLVRDLSKKPEEIHADQFLFVADLSGEGDGGYSYSIVSRYGFDRMLKQLALSGALEEPLDASDGGGRQGVIIYGTSWCGACAAARQFFTAHGVPFVDKDIEKDQKSQVELLRKAKQAGVAVNGVPVIDFRGTLILGFDQARLESLLKGV
jgi:glutaredoxin